MPIYEYHCPANGTVVEVLHPMADRVETWGRLCELASLELGNTPADSPVEKLIYAPGISTPAGDTRLKELGFTKLVKRDTGVYENVTASGTESRYMNANDPSTMPHLKKKIKD
ncbi:MAG: hypothetical protein K1X53_06780 [Candidatus Sumerlaeaceae bacterium]|nr:hypothetical protein [Candidatus Sumerlaeaceae bacterium]